MHNKEHEQKLYLYLSNELGMEDALVVEKNLKECKECAGLESFLQNFPTRQSEPVEPSEGVLQRIKNNFKEDVKSKPLFRFGFGFKTALALGSLALVLVFYNIKQENKSLNYDFDTAFEEIDTQLDSISQSLSTDISYYSISDKN
jgi:hypothetical protein